MIAANIMTTQIVTAYDHEQVGSVYDTMKQKRLRMLPVINQEGMVVGIISTFCIMEHAIPDYVISGDLQQIPYAPDLGILRKKYLEVIECPVSKVMDTHPLLVQKDESLLSVAAAISAHGKHEYAVVVDDNKALLGVISAGDILMRLQQKVSEGNDA